MGQDRSFVINSSDYLNLFLLPEDGCKGSLINASVYVSQQFSTSNNFPDENIEQLF
jgi:hypothetical protein